MEKKIKKRKFNFKLSEKKLIFLLLCITFLVILFLNLLTPLIADDYSYSFGLNHKRISSVLDIILKQYNHYMVWGGRSVAHSIGQFFLMFPKCIFSIANSIVYTLVVYFIYSLAKNGKKDKPLMIIFINFGLYFVLPVFGENCLWLIGSCNYLWTSLFILVLLNFYNKYFSMKNKDTILTCITIFIFGVICGWTNENTAAALVCLLLAILIFGGKKYITKTKIFGICGVIIGFLFMILAPGNYVRADQFTDNRFILVKWIDRALEATVNGINYLWPLLISLTVLILIYIYYKKKIDVKVYLYLFASFIAIYSMVLSPEFPERSWFGVVLFMLISVIYLLFNVDTYNRLFKFTLFGICILTSLYFISDYYYLAKDIYELKQLWNTRISYINDQKNEGNNDIVVTCSWFDNKKNPNYGLADLSKNSTDWPNTEIARYYGIDSIKCVEE